MYRFLKIRNCDRPTHIPNFSDFCAFLRHNPVQNFCDFLRLRSVLLLSCVLLAILFSGSRGTPGKLWASGTRNPHQKNSPGNLNGNGTSYTNILIRRVVELAQPLVGNQKTYSLIIKASVKPPSSILEPRVSGNSLNGETKAIEVYFARTGLQTWRLILISPWRNVELNRKASETELIVPQSRVTFVGKGDIENPLDSLEPEGFISRFITMDTSLYPYFALLASSTIEIALKQFLLPKMEDPAGQIFPAKGDSPSPQETGGTLMWNLKDGAILSVSATGSPVIRLEVASGPGHVEEFKYFEITSSPNSEIPFPVLATQTHQVSMVSRTDLEKIVFRGMRRILSLKLPGPTILAPQTAKVVSHGELRPMENQTLVLLSGTHAEIGKAHGELLGEWIHRTIDSTIYLVGLVETISKGRWFLNDLEDAWKRLSPNIPSEQIKELDAIVSAVPQISRREARLANVFPEYFHCSGFAVFGRATRDGNFYHGRVLDYMSEIGLQQSAVTFVMKPDGKNGFLNAGFAGFIGSVSGMNEKQISLGEMGGGGRFQWDGAPMASLMRRALEDCGTLEEVKALWASSPRTCEYYYVFSDGKIPDAVGVKATPQSIEFLGSGQAHPKIGEGIVDTVVMSAGSRLKTLRTRIKEGFGTFEASSAIRLMDRPVAMKSNLHNVLFLPQKLEVFVAVAGDSQTAAERNYCRYDLGDLLKKLPK